MSQLIDIDLAQFDHIVARVKRAQHADLFGLLDVIGEQQEDAARRRITDTKRSPGGTRWKPWSRDYAKTRRAQHSLLRESGDLANTMTHQPVSGAAAVEVGSPMIYAGVHLLGGAHNPARPYLDTDGEFEDPADRDEITDYVDAFLEDLLA